MQPTQSENFHTVFSSCRRALEETTWARVMASLEKNTDIQSFPDILQVLKSDIDLPGFIDDLARIELAMANAARDEDRSEKPVRKTAVNPTLCLIPASWRHLATLVQKDDGAIARSPEPASVHVMIWRHPATGRLSVREAADIDLLALKIIAEQIEPIDAARAGGVSVESIYSALDGGVEQGILISPESLIRREESHSLTGGETFNGFLTADMFTLQWHITQACDLHCRHCYDRSSRVPMTTEKAVAVLNDLEQFCRRMNVRGQVTFTGGNPLLHPDFFDLYKAARDRGFTLAILGNPTPVDQIERLVKIAEPRFFQVSLEGLEATNDRMRGKGHFQRTLSFLKQLRRLNIYSMVMLTLTRENMSQVIPLGDFLRDKTDFFTFNRLSTVGEGARLLMPRKSDFEAFLRQYTAAAEKNPILGLKDNLINILREDADRPYFGGCTGYGCGAAFNFLALLPDGEVHACRKFPSLIGDTRTDSLFDIYHSPTAADYRNGSEACCDCRLSPVCRGCLAITHSCGMDVFIDKDPFCFRDKQQT